MPCPFVLCVRDVKSHALIKKEISYGNIGKFEDSYSCIYYFGR